jgi:hypothetical protein
MQKKKVLPWEFCIWSIWWKGKTGHGVDIEHAVTLRGISIRWSWALNGKKWLAGDVTLMKLDIWMVWSPNNDECKSDGVRRLSLDGRGDTWQNRVPRNVWNARRRHQWVMTISWKRECRGSPQTCAFWIRRWITCWQSAETVSNVKLGLAALREKLSVTLALDHGSVGWRRWRRTPSGVLPTHRRHFLGRAHNGQAWPELC